MWCAVCGAQVLVVSGRHFKRSGAGLVRARSRRHCAPSVQSNTSERILVRSRTRARYVARAVAVVCVGPARCACWQDGVCCPALGKQKTCVPVHVACRCHQYCDYRARHKSSIVTHELSHGGEKPYKCEHCDYRARQRSAIVNHEVQTPRCNTPPLMPGRVCCVYAVAGWWLSYVQWLCVCSPSVAVHGSVSAYCFSFPSFWIFVCLVACATLRPVCCPSCNPSLVLPLFAIDTLTCRPAHAHGRAAVPVQPVRLPGPGQVDADHARARARRRQAVQAPDAARVVQRRLLG